MGRRRLARESALQALYLADVSGMSAEEAGALVWARSAGLDGKSEAFARSLLEGTAGRRGELDGLIQSVAENWELARMAAVDRNILRLAAYELRLGEAPPGVVIDEALEIAKKFSSEQSFRFINGILDKLKAHSAGAEKTQVPDAGGAGA